MDDLQSKQEVQVKPGDDEEACSAQGGGSRGENEGEASSTRDGDGRPPKREFRGHLWPEAFDAMPMEHAPRRLTSPDAWQKSPCQSTATKHLESEGRTRAAGGIQQERGQGQSEQMRGAEVHSQRRGSHRRRRRRLAGARGARIAGAEQK